MEKHKSPKGNPPLFPLGQVVATPGALSHLETVGIAPLELLQRHVSGDFGDRCAADRKANEEALQTGARILSAYTVGKTGERVWIVTEADRASTCLLRPEEY